MSGVGESFSETITKHETWVNLQYRNMKPRWVSNLETWNLVETPISKHETSVSLKSSQIESQKWHLLVVILINWRSSTPIL